MPSGAALETRQPIRPCGVFTSNHFRPSRTRPRGTPTSPEGTPTTLCITNLDERYECFWFSPGDPTVGPKTTFYSTS